MNSMMEPTPLTILLTAYFHQDFLDETGDAQETVQAYLEAHPRAAVALADESGALARSDRTEEELDEFAEDLGCEYAADWDGGTYREWFASIEAQARAFAAAHPQTPRPHEPGAGT